MPAHQKFHHGRHNGARKKIGGEHGENHCRRERLKEISGGAAQEKDRHKHNADAERRDKRGHGDLHGAVKNRADHRFPHGEIAVDIFKLNGGIIDQDADGECETAKRHDVHRLAKRAKNDNRRQDRQRNGGRHHEGAAPVAQKKQNHQRRETGGDHSFTQNAVDRGTDKNRLVEKLTDFQFLRKRGLNARQRFFDAFDNVEGGCASAFEDSKQRRSDTVLGDDVGLYRKSVAHLGDISDVNHRAVHLLDRQIV